MGSCWGGLRVLVGWNDGNGPIGAHDEPVEAECLPDAPTDVSTLSEESIVSGKSQAVVGRGLIHTLDDLAETGAEVEANTGRNPLSLDEPSLAGLWMAANEVRV